MSSSYTANQLHAAAVRTPPDDERKQREAGVVISAPVMQPPKAAEVTSIDSNHCRLPSYHVRRLRQADVWLRRWQSQAAARRWWGRATAADVADLERCRTSRVVKAASQPSTRRRCTSVRSPTPTSATRWIQTTQSFSVKDLMDWPEERLMRLVEHVQPQHLPVLMNNRLQVHEKESAKNLSFHHVNYVKKAARPC